MSEATPAGRFSVRGLAARWATTERAIRKRVERGTVPYRRDAGRIVFLAADIERFEQGLSGVSVDEALERLGRGA